MNDVILYALLARYLADGIKIGEIPQPYQDEIKKIILERESEKEGVEEKTEDIEAEKETDEPRPEDDDSAEQKEEEKEEKDGKEKK